MDGETVLAAATAEAAAEFGDDLVAAYTLGSLAHGGFAPEVSAVDLALVLRSTGDGTADRVRDVTARTRGRAPGALADRLSVFWADPATVRRGGAATPARLPAVDRLDLLEHGVLRHGTDVRDGAVAPGHAELVAASAEFLAGRADDAWLAGIADPAGLLDGGARAVTKAVLFPVRFLHTLRTGDIGRNDAAVASYDGPHTALATAALHWRDGGLPDADVALGLLTAHLAPLYRECVDAYLAALPAADPSAAGLRSLRTALGGPATGPGGV
ncbi:hypothetical protein Ae168Ps1_0187 [Pseudonocardia sp. Ae168_Ps1]|uniref:hypothetical protein n=1 Tax=unclassified Pseudonocardia TaxID=2619320 RepID=UPI00094B357D|nr:MULTISPECIES: hypothetical protein [unclassified Pseudonocardia]OLL71813.1 hypothetical protein Ae150APs1_0191 [Pseudonocardia sp. Ae150A_Ps1]OLL77781.1 hypothetical protein Ae168Ps1_0187 [Pseudonocardia sp. Ae168_Ps1]OLL88095.1 hypothetical protein Ae263Ps1_5150c [Pseudonocardia sp. Ae263_Ps1]OLL91879.1 hypothetical protein Ae356Ps1_1776 [Pseudonocardia sp. Ae356_Ps1]